MAGQQSILFLLQGTEVTAVIEIFQGKQACSKGGVWPCANLMCKARGVARVSGSTVAVVTNNLLFVTKFASLRIFSLTVV